MLKAQQSAVVQNANINLVGIRSAEIQYFSQFFSSFGVQAALIAGFSINSVSQVPALDADCHPSWKYIYWITSAITFTAAMHVIICSVYISVFGQGFALRGPLGSMVTAVNGMVVEQEQVVTAFLITIVSLAFNLVGTYGIMMDLTGALISSAVTIIGLGFWYHFTLRIYNRFKFAEQKRGFDDDEDEPFDDDSSKHRLAALQPPSKKKVVKANKSFFGRLFSKKKTKSTLGYSKDSGSLRENRDDRDGDDDDDDDTRSEGAKKETSSFSYAGEVTMRGGATFSGSWTRRFIVMKGTSLNIYKTKLTFEREPLKTINKRPISFDGFAVEGLVDEDVFTLHMYPLEADEDRKSLEFRCDTKQELQDWVGAFEAALGGQDQGEDAMSVRASASTVASSRIGTRTEVSTVTSFRTTR